MPRILLHAEASHPMLGNLLDDRYQIIQVLNAGAFGRTYIAKDTLSIKHPKCVIKHLKPASNDSHFLQTVRRLFVSETHTLKYLGEHDRIPQVLAYFEDDQGFYLVQEFIPGIPLSTLLPTSQRCGKRWNQTRTIQLLQEVLSILEFVHGQGIIHGDIKPNNIIKRASDGKYCLIEFGAVRSISDSLTNPPETLDLSFSLPPAGYVPPEQLAHQPKPNSDIYALGAIAIQALTGLHPTQLQIEADKQKWHQQRQVSEQLVSVLNQMVRYHCKDRYQSATEALQALEYLVDRTQESKVSNQEPEATTQTLEAVGPDDSPIYQEIPDISLNYPIDEPEPTLENSQLPNERVRDITIEISDILLPQPVHEPENSLAFLGEEPELVSHDEDSISVEMQMPEIQLNPFAEESEFSRENAPENADLEEDSLAELSPLESLPLVPSPTPIYDANFDSEEANQPQKNKRGFKLPKIPAALAALGVGIAVNAMVMAGGLFYISQPNPSQFKEVEQIINQVQWEEGAKKVCEIPYICFWQNREKPTLQQSKEDVYKLLQQAYKRAEVRDFTGALKHLEKVSPQAPGYAQVKAKIAEYQKKQRIKAEAEKIAKSKLNGNRASR
ncbi:MAG TPA: protein kinase [Leptolyngbyaceae cyanobacterium]